MKFRIAATLLSSCLLLHTAWAQMAPKLSVGLRSIAVGLTAPVALTHAGDGSGRLFVVEQTGLIRIIQSDQLVQTPFLDIRHKIDKLNSSYSEKGLLGLAFHPQYRRNGKFYVYYSSTSTVNGQNHKSVVAEYKVSAQPNQADPNSERVLLTIGQPEGNHNGGHLAFGPDGYLYIGSGDGGGAGDRHGSIGNGQDVKSLLGKMLRIDVNALPPYGAPADNPFAKNDGNGAKEVFAWGLRNPWKFSFDRATGRLFCADVGQNTYEEIDIIERGKNYGWRVMEGLHCYNPPSGCNTSAYAPPIHEYDHGLGISITGGYVYRGRLLLQLQGKYIFGDWSGKLFYLQQVGPQWQRGTLAWAAKGSNQIGTYINSFGEDEAGELYICTQEKVGPSGTSGIIYRITP